MGHCISPVRSEEENFQSPESEAVVDNTSSSYRSHLKEIVVGEYNRLDITFLYFLNEARWEREESRILRHLALHRLWLARFTPSNHLMRRLGNRRDGLQELDAGPLEKAASLEHKTFSRRLSQCRQLDRPLNGVWAWLWPKQSAHLSCVSPAVMNLSRGSMHFLWLILSNERSKLLCFSCDRWFASWRNLNLM